MPIFEFLCENCGQQFEELVFSNSAIKDVTCPECGSEAVRKQISTFASKPAGGAALGGGSWGGSQAASCSTGSL
jgi:putative FmdB family regulatory protein